jgi:hypothetical protein
VLLRLGLVFIAAAAAKSQELDQDDRRPIVVVLAGALTCCVAAAWLLSALSRPTGGPCTSETALDLDVGGVGDDERGDIEIAGHAEWAFRACADVAIQV